MYKKRERVFFALPCGHGRCFLIYFADKLLDFELAILLIVIGYYINKWLDGKK